MKTTLTIDAAGRIVLPQPVRRQFHLRRGSTLDLEVDPDAIILRPTHRTGVLVEDDGLLIHEGQPEGDVAAALGEARTRRDRDILGSGP